jgi:hypothetical protein
MTATTFALWVLIESMPAQQRGTFDSYSRCTEAAVGEAETLREIEGRPVRWECVPVNR